MSTKIEWTDDTWNPVRGCEIVSKGCTNCYAMRQAHRFSGPGRAYEGLTTLTKGGPVWTGKVRLVPELLDAPLHWRTPRRIFVNSMSDLFHESVPEIFIASVLGIAAACPQHSFQVLTKRPQRMRAVLRSAEFLDAYEASVEMYTHTETPWPPRNVWLGVSVEDQASADERIPLLLETPATVRWISAEPLLALVRLRAEWLRCPGGAEYGRGLSRTAVHAGCCEQHARLDWVVAGGESGPGARPSHPDWFRSLRDQCAAAGVPFLFKQWGGHLPGELKAGEVSIRWQDGRTEWYGDHQDIKYGDHWLSNEHGRLVIAWPTPKAKAGRTLDGRLHDEYPA